MTYTLEPETVAVFGNPQFYEVPRGMDPEAFENPHRHAVWDMAMGATLTVSATEADGTFRLMLNVSDRVKADGIMVRLANQQQVADFAHNLLRVIGGGVHELAVNLRDALIEHEKLVERRAQNIAEQVVEPLRQVMKAQIERADEALTARSRQFSDVEDRLREQIKELAKENERLQQELDTAHGRQVDADETLAVPAQSDLDGHRLTDQCPSCGAPRNGTDWLFGHKAGCTWQASADATLGPFQRERLHNAPAGQQ